MLSTCFYKIKNYAWKISNLVEKVATKKKVHVFIIVSKDSGLGCSGWPMMECVEDCLLKKNGFLVGFRENLIFLPNKQQLICLIRILNVKRCSQIGNWTNNNNVSEHLLKFRIRFHSYATHKYLLIVYATCFCGKFSLASSKKIYSLDDAKMLQKITKLFFIQPEYSEDSPPETENTRVRLVLLN